MKDYIVRTCLQCNHTFKSRIDTVHVRCSVCGSVKVVDAINMPPNTAHDIEINKLKEIIAGHEKSIENIIKHVKQFESDTIGQINKLTPRVRALERGGR